MLRYVDVETLNLCAAPVVAPRSRLSILHLGQPVELLGPAAAPGWLRVVAQVGGRDVAGLVPAAQDGGSTLRRPVDPAREALVARAVHEWLRFAHGLGKAERAPFSGHVEEMRRSVGQDPADKAGWAAAALSFMVRHAAASAPAYHRFPFSCDHQEIAQDAIEKLRCADRRAPFWGYRAEERMPAIGDVLLSGHRSPRGPVGTTRAQEPPAFAQVVVSLRPGRILAIGGDVHGSVGMMRLGGTGPARTGLLLLSNRAGTAR